MSYKKIQKTKQKNPVLNNIDTLVKMPVNKLLGLV